MALMSLKPMKDNEMTRIGTFIEQQFGICMPDSKKVMIESRLSKRLRELGIGEYGEYFDYILSDDTECSELPTFIDLVSTHETRFFRESGHFEFLYRKALPELIKQHRYCNRPLRILSAACSSGEEAYSIACMIEEYKRCNGLHDLEYEITGTDISEIVLNTARKAVYPKARIGNVPADFLHRYFLKSRNRNSSLVRVVPALRQKAQFHYMNLVQDNYFFRAPFDIIFCCNVFIYFRRSVQEAICRKLLIYLNDSGYFLTGHSESLVGCELPLYSVAPSVYRKK